MNRNSRWPLIAAIAAVVAGMGVMLACGYYAFIWKTAIIPILLLVAWLAKRFESFVEDWAVFLGLIILFDFVRGLIFAVVRHFEHPVYMQYAIAWERWLCGGEIMPVFLQQWRASLSDPLALDRVMTVTHASHFAFFLLFGFAVWVLRPEGFRRYAVAVIALIYAGALIYFLVPTVPPWMAAATFGVLPPIEHITAAIYNAEIPTLQRAFDVNPIAAMPSLHAALPVLCVLVAVKHFRWWAIPVATYVGLVLLAIMYLGEHYLVDIVAGVLLALFVFAITYRLGLGFSSSSALRVRVHPLLMTALLLALAHGLGQITVSLDRPFAVTPDFVERELAGTPMADLFRGRLAFDRGDLPRARAAFERAVVTTAGTADQRSAELWLARTAYRQREYETVITTLSPGTDDRDGLDVLTLLAVAYLEAAQPEAGEALLSRLVARFPGEPEPVYWLTRSRFQQRRLSTDEVREVAAHLGALPDRSKADHFRVSLLALVSN